MGGSNPIKKAAAKVKKKVKDVGEGKVAKFAFNPVGQAQASLVKDTTGVDIGQFQAGAVEGALAKQFVENPRRQKEAEQQFQREAKAAQETQLAEAERQKEQSEAEKKAGESLLRSSSRQRRRRKSKGRASTILSEDLGNIGGEGTSKRLLGL